MPIMRWMAPNTGGQKGPDKLETALRRRSCPRWKSQAAAKSEATSTHSSILHSESPRNWPADPTRAADVPLIGFELKCNFLVQSASDKSANLTLLLYFKNK